MGDLAQQLIQSNLDDHHLTVFGTRLCAWLLSDLADDEPVSFTESRAKALLRGTGFADDPTLHDFARLMESETAVRLALYDLLDSTGLGEQEEVQALAATSGAVQVNDTTETRTVDWLTLAIAAQAWKSEYPLQQLDPASLPTEHSVAGQLLRRAATFLRQQVQRTATERDKLLRKLAYTPGTAVPHTPNLNDLQEQAPIVAAPPHYRSPIPVRYPEYEDEVQVDSDDITSEPQTSSVTRSAQITITEDDLSNEQRPITMPAIKITADQIPAGNNTQTRSHSSHQNREDLNAAVQRRFRRDKEPLKPVRLRIVVQEYQDGPGVFGLQVVVSSPGIKAYVAGTTNRDGTFLCELPVRVRSGLTYDVDITWPRDHGGETERKSITLNIDRTEFTLPFYYRLTQ